MTVRRFVSRLPLLAFVIALVLKGAIPLFASWSAHLQGKGVAEVCDVYGVALPRVAGTTSAPDEHAMHAMHAMHSMHDGSAVHGMQHNLHSAPSHDHGDGPHRPDSGSHAGDHCVLGALVAFAGNGASVAPSLAVAHDRDAPFRPQWSADPVGSDASARWAALLGHGPPDFS